MRRVVMKIGIRKWIKGHLKVEWRRTGDMVCCLVGLTSGSNVGTECSPEQRHNLNIISDYCIYLVLHCIVTRTLTVSCIIL